MGDRWRLYVAEDHPVFLDALLRMFKQRPELEVVGHAANGRAALEEIGELKPDIAVADVDMPELDGLELLRAIERESLPTRVIILSGSLDDERIYLAVAEGARGFLAKTDSKEQICDAIVAVARGTTVVSGAFQEGLAGQIRKRGTGEERTQLSDRELEVLRLLADGLTAVQIGERLHLAAPTVRTHLAKLYEKLGVSTGTAAVAAAMRQGVLD